MTTMETSRQDTLNLRVGELVEVRSESEILATLDEKGELEALPFMPEMRQFCGQRLRVHKRAPSSATRSAGPGFIVWRTRCTSRVCAATARPMADARPDA
jgi:hypothetical protein